MLFAKYNRNQSKGSGYEDNFIISFDHNLSDNSSYNFSLKNTSTELVYEKDTNGLNLNVISNFDFFKDEPEYGFYLKAETQY